MNILFLLRSKEFSNSHCDLTSGYLEMCSQMLGGLFSDELSVITFLSNCTVV